MGFYGEYLRVSGIHVRCNVEQPSFRVVPSFSRSAESLLFGFEKKPFYILVWRIILVQTGRNLRPKALLCLLNMYVLQLLPGKLP